MGFFGSKEYEKMKGKLPEEDILYACKGDLNSQGEFENHYLLLTKEKLLLVGGESRSPQKVYAGYIGKYTPPSLDEPLCLVASFSLQEVEKIWVQPFLSGGTVCLKTLEEEKMLFCFTSGLTAEANRMVSLAIKVKKGKEITEEDIKEKEKRPNKTESTKRK